MLFVDVNLYKYISIEIYIYNIYIIYTWQTTLIVCTFFMSFFSTGVSIKVQQFQDQ